MLGPILFMMYMNDLPSVVKNALKIFTNSTNVYNTVSEANEVIMLQTDLDSIVHRADYPSIQGNVNPCISAAPTIGMYAI